MKGENIPSEMKDYPQWVLGKHVLREGKKTKVPYSVQGSKAKVNDTSTGASFDDVEQAYYDNPSTYDGIGFVLTEEDPYLAIDLDKCIEQGSEPPKVVTEIMEKLDSYTEISPSKKGLRMIAKGSLPEYVAKKRSDIEHIISAEVYDRGRYVTITGDVTFGKVKAVKQVSDDYFPWYCSLGNKPQILSGSTFLNPKANYVAEIMQIVKQSQDDAKTGSEFWSLYQFGDLSKYNSDHSAADLRLTSLIANKAGFQKELIDTVFRSSKLMRAKGDRKHRSDGATYGDMTIDKVLQDRQIYHKGEIEGFLSYHYTFRKNVVKDRVELMYPQTKGWEELNDYHFFSILRKIQHMGGKISEAKLRAILASDFVSYFNPFEDYYNSLPKVTGTSEIDKLLALIPVKDREYFQKTFPKWMIASVACSIEENAINHTVVVWQGPQGYYKTTLTRKLVPESLRDDYFYSGIIDPNNKDTMIYMSRTFFINLDELEKLSPSKEAAMKSIITQGTTLIRRSYGRYEEKRIRRASFIASTNETNILADLTGSRRYLIYPIVAKIEGLEDINMDKVGAEVYSLYKKGTRYWFNGSEEDEINAYNNQFRYVTAAEEMLLTYYRPAKKDDSQSNSKGVTASEIIAELRSHNLIPSNVSSSYMGRLLMSHSFERKISAGITRYRVVLENRDHTVFNHIFRDGRYKDRNL